MNSKIIGITGHQEIPQEAIPFIQHGIRTIINGFQSNIVGVSSLATGADQLFASSILNVGGKLQAIIPCDKYETTFSRLSDLEMFNYLLNSSEVVIKLNYKSPSEDAFFDAGCMVVDTSEILLAVWDGQIAKGKGGTADIVKYANSKKKEVVIIWPLGIKR